MRNKKRSVVEIFHNQFASLRTRLFTRLIAPAFWSVGKGSLVVPPFRFGNLHLVRLGQGVAIHGHCWLLTLANTGQEESPKITIGDGTSLGPYATIAAAQRVQIGNRVLFASNVYIADHGHHFADVSRPVMDQGIRKIEAVSIGDGSWIGQNAVLLPGSTIGRNCVIGANAVVNTVIPDYTVAAGNPARVIKRYNQKTNEWEKVV